MKRISPGLIAAIAALAIALIAIARIEPLDALLTSGVFAFISLIAGILGLTFGLFALRTSRRMRQDIDRVALSLDGALKTLATIGSRNTSTIEELADAVNRDIGRLSERLDRTDVERPGANGGNVVSLPTPGRTARSPKAANQQKPAALPIAAPTGPIEIHLEPIVSIVDSAATGFEAYAGVRLVNGEEHLTRRLSDLVPAAERIQFELDLFEAVVTASRRQLGSNVRDLPIHIAVSRAFLEDAKAVARVQDVFKMHSGLEGQIVISLAEAPTTLTTTYAKALARLAQAGAHFALEAAPEADSTAPQLAASGITFVKLSANRLLDRERSRSPLRGGDIVHNAAAANIAVIATGVGNDEDVLALMDLGVNLMAGPRFSGPRRLKPLQSGPASVAL